MKTKSQQVAEDVAAHLRARSVLIWIVSREEARVERYLTKAAQMFPNELQYPVATWDVAAGFSDLEGDDAAESRDPGNALARINEVATNRDVEAKRGLWIMRDLPNWITGPGGATTLRQMRNLVRALPDADLDRAQAVVVLSPSGEVPPELANHATVIEWPLPDREEIAEILDAAIAALPENLRAAAAPNGTRDAAIDAAVGLSEEEAHACYAKSLIAVRKIDPVIVAKEKKGVIARAGVLEWIDPIPGGLDAVGGLDNLKSWLMERSAAFSSEARAFGLQFPKGAMVVGIPGTGKSLIAKSISTAWRCPLIKMDLGALKDKFVGDSEKNIRKCFAIIEALGFCVLWIDEIEKSLQGATSGSSDGGTSSDQLGALLNWMQERKSPCFVIATANDVSALPPELLRAGRFDKVWFVDLPTKPERASILQAALHTNGRHVFAKMMARDGLTTSPDVARIVAATEGFTGAEIASIVPESMFAAFADGKREIRVDDLVATAGKVVPLTKTAAGKIKALREWAEGKASPAGGDATAAKAAPSAGRKLDV